MMLEVYWMGMNDLNQIVTRGPDNCVAVLGLPEEEVAGTPLYNCSAGVGIREDWRLTKHEKSPSK